MTILQSILDKDRDAVLDKLNSLKEWNDDAIKAAWKKTASMSQSEYNQTVQQNSNKYGGYSHGADPVKDALARQAEDTPENRESKKRYKDFLKNKFSSGSNLSKGI